MENTFQQIFKREYNRASFTENVLLPVFQNSVKEIKIFDEDAVQKEALTETDLKSAKGIFKYGEITTNDNRQIDLYEVTLQDTKQVKLARVGIGALVKKLIIGNNAAFVNFRYQEIEDRHWRFSFIAYDSFFEDGQVISKETNPKRYTYVFGDEDETYRTAIDRFLDLYNATNIKVKDIQDAFAVEAMSDEFFKEYREVHYQNFIRFLTGEEIQKKGSKYQLVKVQEPSNFLTSVFNGDKKEARDFCKKLLGQIVFLYFLQKKGWLGASNTDYQDGDKNFIQNFFKQAGENETFYPVWLSKLFYDTLNEKRNGDDFTLPNGETAKIPYLNGGLFEKENNKYDFLVFPADLFTSLFEFFNRFNFTIYENSPEEHTIAVDPEMLGHIFENLLEDNKDKGAFYTPKEIVQYMTQESLIEYLATHIGQTEKEGISTFVKQKNKEFLSDKVLKQIDRLLDDIKVCDPAIGSGAFPMGLLQEIFMLKERIAFDLGFSVWSPATVKENIIQNSIYGVDIEKGAVDIAQLRFWLSLVVDEDKPKPLPNLAYKIVVGNSLVSKFGEEIIEIDWSTDTTKGGLFGQDLITEKIELLKKISETQKKFFSANNTEKDKLKKQIRKLKLDILGNQLAYMIETKGTTLDSNAAKKPSKKQTEAWLETEGWKRAIKEINTLKKNDKPFEHFDWKLDFPEILNPLVNENAGFDIVIGNPPYKIVYDKIEKKQLEDRYPTFKRNNDLYVAFIEKGINLLKENCGLTYINPNTFLNGDYFVNLRKFLSKNQLIEIVDFKNSKVFKEATVFVCVFTVLKQIGNNYISNYITLGDKMEDRGIKTIEITFDSDNSFIPNHQILDQILTKPHVTFDEICFIKDVGFNYWSKGGGKTRSANSVGKRVLYSGKKEFENDIPFIKGRDIDNYSISIPSNYLKHNYQTFLNENDTFRFSESFLHRNPKIVYRQTSDKIIAALDTSKYYCDKTVHVIVHRNQNENEPKILKHLLSLLNSTLFKFLYTEISKEESGRTFSQVKTTYIKKLPAIIDNTDYTSLLVDYILFLKSNKNILSHTDNDSISSHIESILDMMVYELYFTEHMKEKGLNVLEFMNPKPFTEDTSNEKKAEIIKKFYEWFQEPENAVRQRMLLIETRSPDILAVINSATQ